MPSRNFVGCYSSSGSFGVQTLESLLQLACTNWSWKCLVGVTFVSNFRSFLTFCFSLYFLSVFYPNETTVCFKNYLCVRTLSKAKDSSSSFARLCEKGGC